MPCQTALSRARFATAVRRSEAPCFESNSERMADAGAQSMSVGHYIEGGGVRVFTVLTLRSPEVVSVVGAPSRRQSPL